MPHTLAAHQVVVHDPAGLPIGTAVAFLAAPVARGEAALVVATPAHRRRIAGALDAAGVDVGAARSQGRYVELDATATVSALLSEDGSPSEELFCLHVVSLAASLAERFGAVSAYGEMVGVLADAGRLVAALQLEELWAEALAELPLRLLCGYPAGSLDAGDELAHVCAAHDALAPARTATVAVALPLDATAGLVARRTLVEACAAWGLVDEEWLDDASLVVSELVGNAVRHTGTVPALQLDRVGDHLVVHVLDGSPRLPSEAVRQALSESGRGLQIVDALVDRWGVQPRDSGKVVWARTRPCPRRVAAG